MHPVFHISEVQPYVEPEYDWPGRDTHNRPAPQLVDGETEWEVESVIGKQVRMEEKKGKKGRKGAASRRAGLRSRGQQPVEEVPVVEYLVKWKGYTDDDATWKRAEDLTNSQEAVQEYELLLKQQLSKEESGEALSEAEELGVATAMECSQTDGQPVRCAFLSVGVQTAESGSAASSHAQPAAVGSEPVCAVVAQPAVVSTAAVRVVAQAREAHSVAAASRDPAASSWSVVCSRQRGQMQPSLEARQPRPESAKSKPLMAGLKAL